MTAHRALIGLTVANLVLFTAFFTRHGEGRDQDVVPVLRGQAAQ